MGGKMNWDRVQKENLSMRNGSAWIGSDAVELAPGTQTQPYQNERLGISGCVCGKTVGFKGAHKKRCPLVSRSANSLSSLRPDEVIAHAKSNLQENRTALRRDDAGKLNPAAECLSSLRTVIRLAPTLSAPDQRGALKLVAVLLEALASDGQLTSPFPVEKPGTTGRTPDPLKPKEGLNGAPRRILRN